MTAPTFYIETSVWGSLARRQGGDRRRLVERLVRLLDGSLAHPVISVVVTREIAQAPQEDAKALLGWLEKAQPLVLDVSAAALKLAACYIDSKVLPASRDDDATHIALATVNGLDYLVSWNHRHITGRRKREEYQQINRENGYEKSPIICNPKEAADALQQRRRRSQRPPGHG